MKEINRRLEIDFTRGFFIICVVIFHFLWDLNFFFDLKIGLYSSFGSFLQRLGASSFFLLLGISTILQKNIKGDNYSFKTALVRGGKILLFAIIISVAVNFSYPQNNIIFGVLHCLGVCTIMVFPFINRKYLALIVGAIYILAAKYVHSYIVTTKFLIPFGMRYYGFQSVDYFPLFPWFGVALLGIFFGNILYKKDKENVFLSKVNNFLKKREYNFFIKILILAGQKSAYVYILHQPILYGLCYLIYKFSAK